MGNSGQTLLRYFVVCIGFCSPEYCRKIEPPFRIFLRVVEYWSGGELEGSGTTQRSSVPVTDRTWLHRYGSTEMQDGAGVNPELMEQCERATKG